MSKTEFIYHNQTLFVNLNGEYSSKNINMLKNKLYGIIDKYGINDVVVNKNHITKIDNAAFYDMLDDYDIKYGGNLIIDE